MNSWRPKQIAGAAAGQRLPSRPFLAAAGQVVVMVLLGVNLPARIASANDTSATSMLLPRHQCHIVVVDGDRSWGGMGQVGMAAAVGGGRA
jgi:hypothetical protein